MKSIETRGDSITHDLIQLLNTQYVTPFDREDIYDLATAIDDVVDYIEEASDLLELYRVEQPARQALEQCRVLVTRGRAPVRARSTNLKGMRGVQHALVEVQDWRTRATASCARASPPCSTTPDRPAVVIRWKDIFESLERRSTRARRPRTCSPTSR